MATPDQIFVTVTNSNSFGSVGDVIAALALALSLVDLIVLAWLNRISVVIDSKGFTVEDSDYKSMSFTADMLVTNRSRLPVSITKMNISTKSGEHKHSKGIIPTTIYSLNAENADFTYKIPIDDKLNFDKGVNFIFNASRGKPRCFTLYRDSVIKITRFRVKDLSKNNRRKK